MASVHSSQDSSSPLSSIGLVGRGDSETSESSAWTTEEEESWESPKVNRGQQVGFLHQRTHKLLLKMLLLLAKYQREVCILFLLFATGFASLRSPGMKSRSTPTPQPFFPPGEALVEDYYRGDYMILIQEKIPRTPSLVFYYAPWDSESVGAREVFLSVAHFFNETLPGQVRFYAVNCWWPQGECRRNYKNLSHFPIFVAHLEKNAGIIYSGPIRAQLIVKFLNSLLKPITRIDSEEEMWRFRGKHDAIMLGYFNFTDPDSTLAYETYLQMALRNFEADPFGQVGFGVFLKQELALKFFLTSSNVISLVLFNEIHTAKWTGDGHSEGLRGPVGQVANWVMERTKKSPITWVYQVRSGFANRPVALAPVHLRDELRKGPLILLITRRYFPSSYSPFYAQVKEVALDYFNCNKSGNVTKLRRTGHQLSSEWLSLWNSVSRVCTSGQVSGTCSILSQELKHWRSNKGALRPESLANYETISSHLNFTGFSCSSERPFKFLAIDPVDMPYFADLGKLGLGGLGFNDNEDPMLFLIDAENDIVLPFLTFNISGLAQLIYEYTNQVEKDSSSPFLAQDGLRPAPQKIPFHKLKDNEMKLKELGKSSHSQFIPSIKLERNRVQSITSEELGKYLNGEEPKESLFLMFTAKFCGICGVSLTHFLALSTLIFEHYDPAINVTFAKLDMFKNSLPQELRPKHLPAFVYYQAHNREKGRVFPPSQVGNTKNLLRFLLSEIGTESRVKMSLSSPGCSGNVGRDYCLKINRLSVSGRIQEVLSRLQTHPLLIKDVAMSQDLEDLRAMNIALTVS